MVCPQFFSTASSGLTDQTAFFPFLARILPDGNGVHRLQRRPFGGASGNATACNTLRRSGPWLGVKRAPVLQVIEVIKDGPGVDDDLARRPLKGRMRISGLIFCIFLAWETPIVFALKLGVIVVQVTATRRTKGESYWPTRIMVILLRS